MFDVEITSVGEKPSVRGGAVRSQKSTLITVDVEKKETAVSEDTSAEL